LSGVFYCAVVRWRRLSLITVVLWTWFTRSSQAAARTEVLRCTSLSTPRPVSSQPGLHWHSLVCDRLARILTWQPKPKLQKLSREMLEPSCILFEPKPKNIRAESLELGKFSLQISRVFLIFVKHLCINAHTPGLLYLLLE